MGWIAAQSRKGASLPLSPYQQLDRVMEIESYHLMNTTVRTVDRSHQRLLKLGWGSLRRNGALAEYLPVR